MGRHRPPSATFGPELEVSISAIGARGDGIAETAQGRVFVPLTVPGDRVRVRLGPASGEGRRAEALDWLERGAGRCQPACAHFGRCGGCSLQHLAPADYLTWKGLQVASALSRAGFSQHGSPRVTATSAGGRRRASFTVTRRGSTVRVGFKERQSHRLVDLSHCPVLVPELVALLPALRRYLCGVLPEGSEIEAVASKVEGGIDLLLVGPSRLDLPARQALAELAEAADLGRLSWQPDQNSRPEPVAARRLVWVRFGGVAVESPPGAFLQASAEGEAALVGAVLDGLGVGAGTVADLFAGCGTFALPLTKAGWRVHAVEGNGLAHAALAQAACGVARLSTELRDLSRQPLGPSELARYSAVVLDPPRSGAATQCAALALAAVPLVVMVSCNPATFARDVRPLAHEGYRLVASLAVDQFLWSSHVELVAVLRRS